MRRREFFGLFAAATGLPLVARAQQPANRAPSSAGAAAASLPLPKDVDPVSRFRLPLPKKEDMDDYGKKVWDKALDPRRPLLAGLQGPTGIRLWSPHIAEAYGGANTYLRVGTGFGDRITEIAILTTAREMENQFEWTAHEVSGLKVGVEPTIVDIIKHRKPVVGLGEKETVVIKLGRELFGQKKVSSDTFADARRLFGNQGIVDLVSLMAHYSATSALLNAFDMQLPEGQKPLLPVQ
jgi:4-carboxymuconolactone decarboxylase